MSKRLLLTAGLLCLIGWSGVYAKILRVGYLGKPVAGVDFTAFDNTLIAAAATGDTIQIYQNNNLVNGAAATITKRLVFIGFGYLLDKNPGLQATALADYSVSMYFNSGSEGSVVQGINVNSIYIAVNDITITRSRINGAIYLGYNAITAQQPAISNINIYGNFFPGQIVDYGIVTNLLLSNNIHFFSISLDNSSGLFANNIVHNYTPNLNSFFIKNNIFTNICVTSAGSVFHNNLFGLSTGSCPNISGNANQFSVNMSNVFVNYGTITADNQFVLKAGSPAINAGIDGSNNPTDAGVFGGNNGYVYKLSGIPAIPSIYQLTAPTQTTSGNSYTVTVSIRSNN